MATILVVDDQPINRKLLVTLLGYAKHRMLEAADGAEALDIARAARPDLIITDIVMPRMDGFEFIRSIRSDAVLAATRVIFYTATFLQAEAQSLAQACGVSHVIVKPSDPEEILNTVSAALSDTANRANQIPSEEFDREHLRLMTNKLSEKVEELEQANLLLTQEMAQRKRAELALRESQEKIERLNRLQAVLSGINSAIVRIQDRQEFLGETARIALEQGKFRAVRIALLDSAGSVLTPVAWAGVETGFLSSDSVPEVVGIAQAALETKTPVLCNDLETDPVLTPWKRAALTHGCRSAVALPLLRADNVIGVIELYASEPSFLHERELDLLKDLAADVSFALEYFGKEERLKYLAYYDPLTGLANRSLFCDRLNQLIHGASQDTGKLGVMVLDLERFSVINETFGRSASDSLLRQATERLKAAIHHSDCLAHVSRSGFAVYLPSIKKDADVAHFFEQIVSQAAASPFTVEGDEVKVSLKAGISVYPNDGADGETLLMNAETALRRTTSAVEHYLFYSPEMNARTIEKLTLENKLRRALQKNELVLYYQPKIELKTGQIRGLEALMRWNDPDRGLIPPGTFIPVLEESGLILEAGRWALEQAASDYRRWMAQGLHPPRVSVNVSPLQLRQKDFVVNVATAIEKCRNGAPPLDLEITESLIMENIQQNIAKLKTLKEMGVDVAIDDFGTGYSSLSYIAKLPVTALKIDRSFILDLEQNPASMSIVSAIISLAHSFDLKVIAEGVETEQQSQLLKLLRCDEFQGFLFSPAVPPNRVERLLGGMNRLRSSE